MTGFIQLFVIAVSLAMDALSVSIAGGMQAKKASIKNAIKVALFFGGFQAFMPVIGWIIGDVMQGYIAAIDHWVAFVLLSLIGINMIKESLKSDENKDEKDMLTTKNLSILALATSIDALIVGITLSVLQVPFIVSIITIGVITFILCFFGYLFGSKLGEVFGKRVEILGGIALIAIGTKILLENLLF